MENWQFALRAALRDNCVSLETSAAQAPEQEKEELPLMLMMMSTVQDLWKLLTVSASNRKQWAKAAEFTCGQWPRAWTLRKLWLPTECRDRDIMQKKPKRKCWKNAEGIKSTDGMTDGQAGTQKAIAACEWERKWKRREGNENKRHKWNSFTNIPFTSNKVFWLFKRTQTS